jgi:hypothetical protein
MYDRMCVQIGPLSKQDPIQSRMKYNLGRSFSLSAGPAPAAATIWSTRPCRFTFSARCSLPAFLGPDQCAWLASKLSRNGPATSAWFNGFVACVAWTGASKTTTTTTTAMEGRGAGSRPAAGMDDLHGPRHGVQTHNTSWKLARSS